MRSTAATRMRSSNSRDARPVRLARYIAESALRSRSATSSPTPSAIAIPIDGPQDVLVLAERGPVAPRTDLMRSAIASATRERLDVRGDDELVACEPREHVAVPHGADKPLRGDPQQRDRLLVAQGVVDHLEVVQVEEQHGELAAGRVRLADLPADARFEKDAIGEAGQRIVGRAMLGLHAEAIALGDLQHRDDHRATELEDLVDRRRVHAGSTASSRPATAHLQVPT